MTEPLDPNEEVLPYSRIQTLYAILVGLLFFCIFWILVDLHKGYLAFLSAIGLYFGSYKFIHFVSKYQHFRIVLAALVLVHLAVVWFLPFSGISGPAILLGPVALVDAVVVFMIFDRMVQKL